jgi:membrane protease YdiL (CAAX protease family)
MFSAGARKTAPEAGALLRILELGIYSRVFYRRAMRPLRTLIIYIAVVFIGGALLAPWLYFLAQHFAGHFPKIANSPFHRYVNRALLGLALIGLWPLLKNLGATSPRDFGLVNPFGQLKKLGGGFLLGFFSLAIVAAIALASGARTFEQNLTHAKLGEKILAAAGAAIVVSVLEEILFRGGLFGSLKKVFHWIFALVISSAIYAIVHFMESASEPSVVTWRSGLDTLALMLRNFTNWHAVFPGFFNLALAGAILALAYQRTGNLYFSIGLHAGWIFWLKSYGFLTVSNKAANAWIWGGGRLAIVNGWLALPVLVAALLVFMRIRFGKTSNAQHPTFNIQ